MGSEVAPDHGVPHERIGFTDLVGEQEMGVVDVAEVGEGAESKDAAGGEGIEDEAGPGHVCLDLLQFQHGAAGFHDQEGRVGDEEIGVGVPFGFGKLLLCGGGCRRRKCVEFERDLIVIAKGRCDLFR